MSDWIILRTSSRSTLRLAKQLTDIGIEAWSPSKVRNGKIPHRRARLPLREPILASFVFARAANANRLIGLELFNHSLPSFSLFRHDNRVPLVADRELETLRTVEAREDMLAKRRARKQWRPDLGQTVRVSDGAAAGLEGTVESLKGGFAVVSFGGKLSMKIAAFLLEDDGVSEPQRIAA